VKGPVQSSLNGVAFRDVANGWRWEWKDRVDNLRRGRSWKEAKKVTKVHLFDVTWTGILGLPSGEGSVANCEQGGVALDRGATVGYDLAWHTRVITRFGTTYVSGGTTGVLDRGFGTFSRQARGGEKLIEKFASSAFAGALPSSSRWRWRPLFFPTSRSTSK